MSDGEYDEPRTPSGKKDLNRAKNRQIVRWTDEKLAFCFAEFRNFAAKQKIDIKKPLDDAAKMIAPFLTGDALIQQLAKRRIRYLDDIKKQEEETGIPANLGGTPSSRRATATPSTPLTKKGTPSKRKTNLQREVAELADALSPDDVVQSIETPTISVKRKSRAAGSKRTPVAKVKAETTVTPEILTDSESEYEESPKKKRVRGGARAVTAKPKSYKEMPEVAVVEDEDDEDDTRTHLSEDEWVDDAGGENVRYRLPSTAEPSPTEATFPSQGVKYPSVAGQSFGGKSIPNQDIARNDSLFSAQPSEHSFDMSATSANTFGMIQDIFYDQAGNQRVQPGPILPSMDAFGVHSFNQPGYLGGYAQLAQDMMAPMYDASSLNGTMMPMHSFMGQQPQQFLAQTYGQGVMQPSPVRNPAQPHHPGRTGSGSSLASGMSGTSVTSGVPAHSNPILGPPISFTTNNTAPNSFNAPHDSPELTSMGHIAAQRAQSSIFDGRGPDRTYDNGPNWGMDGGNDEESDHAWHDLSSVFRFDQFD